MSEVTIGLDAVVDGPVHQQQLDAKRQIYGVFRPGADLVAQALQILKKTPVLVGVLGQKRIARLLHQRLLRCKLLPRRRLNASQDRQGVVGPLLTHSQCQGIELAQQGPVVAIDIGHSATVFLAPGLGQFIFLDPFGVTIAQEFVTAIQVQACRGIVRSFFKTSHEPCAGTKMSPIK